MITGIVGKVGGGKSLLALAQMLEHMGHGGCVATNIDLDDDGCARYLWRRRRQLSRSQIVPLDLNKDIRFQKQIPRGTPLRNVRVFIDEAHLHYNADDHRELSAQFKDIKGFITQSRKARVDVCFITQAWDTLYMQFRKQALFLYKCRDFREINFPIFGKLPGMGLLWSKCCAATDQVLENGRTPLSKELFRCYSTTQVYDDTTAALFERMPQFVPRPNKISWLSSKFTKPKIICE